MIMLTAWQTTAPPLATWSLTGFLLGDLTTGWGLLKFCRANDSDHDLKALLQWWTKLMCFKVNERDLRHIFSQHGTVKEVKIVLDHSGVSRGWVHCLFPLIHRVRLNDKVCTADFLSFDFKSYKRYLHIYCHSKTRSAFCFLTDMGLLHLKPKKMLWKSSTM